MEVSTVNTLKVKLLTGTAKAPTRGSTLAAGVDLYAAEAVEIKGRDHGIVSTQIALGIPEGCYGRIAPRSGLAAKYGIDVGAGVIDRDYTGEIKVILLNHSETPFKIEPGDHIAQLILEKCVYAHVETVTELDPTTRGGQGFGSSGK